MRLENSTQTAPVPASPSRGSSAPERPYDLVFYDGDCGFCHAWVRFAARRDRQARLRFAPIGGATFLSQLEASRRALVPDSVVVLARSGELLVRSDAAAHLLASLGGPWPRLARALRACPRRLRDPAYALAARLRRGLGRAPEGSCPRVPPELGQRFLP